MPRPCASSRAPRTAGRRAAAQLAVVLGIRPQLERHADRLRRVLGDEQRGDRAVHAAAQRDERPARLRRQPGGACGRAERAVKGVGRELRGVTLGCAEPAQLARDLPRADLRRVEQRRPARERDHGAARRDHRAAPARVEACLRDASRARSPGSIASEMRTRSPQAAPPAAPVCGVRRHVAASEGAFEVACQLLRARAHSSESKAAYARSGRGFRGGGLRRRPGVARRRPAGRSAPVCGRACPPAAPSACRRPGCRG